MYIYIYMHIYIYIYIYTYTRIVMFTFVTFVIYDSVRDHDHTITRPQHHPVTPLHYRTDWAASFVPMPMPETACRTCSDNKWVQ